MNNGFDWTLVRSFLAVLEHGSLVKAADAIGSSQPTVGRHIGDLEAQLGLVLFERTGRGLMPTAMAAKLANSARTMENGAFQLARAATSAQANDAGTVRISASEPIACFILPKVLLQMRVDLPDIRIELVASDSISNLLRREADIALRMVQPDQASVVARRVGKVTIGVYAHRDYLRLHGTPRVPADLLKHDILCGDRNEEILLGLRNFGIDVLPGRLVLKTDNLVAYWHALKVGLGIGFVADYLAAAEPDLVKLLPSLPIPALPMWLAVHREIRSNSTIRLVYSHLAKNLPGLL